MTSTSGKVTIQPFKFLTDTVEDPASRYNLDIASQAIQSLQQQANGRNYFISSPVTMSFSTAGANTKLKGLEGSLTTTGRPVIVAVIPGAYKAPNLAAGVYSAGGTSFIACESSVTPTSSCDLAIRIYRNSSFAFWTDYRMDTATANVANKIRIGGVQILAFDPQPSGTYRYELYAQTSANGLASISNTSLLLLEF